MSGRPEVTVTGLDYWAAHVGDLADRLALADVTEVGPPQRTTVTEGEALQVKDPGAWAANQDELREALRVAGYAAPTLSGLSPVGTLPGHRNLPKPEDRLVYTVEEAANLLGISRSFAYEAVQKGLVPSMRIGRRILVPKAALERFLAAAGDTGTSSST